MNNDEIFRVALLIIFLIVIPIALYYRLKSEVTREKLDRRQEGLFILFMLRLVGAVCFLGIVAWMVNPRWMAWSSIALPNWLRWVGVCVGVLAGALHIWTFQNLGKNLTDTVVTRKDHSLVTNGPYQWVRHPFYDSAALYILAISLAMANWFPFLAGGLVLALLVARTPKEEEKLLARFGDDYRAYTERTGRFLPKMRAR